MPRVKKFDQEKVFEKALHLFWEKGYEATSLSDLTDQLGIGKGSFYDTFGSKKQLFDNCLSAYRMKGYEALDSFLAKKTNPIEGIAYFLDKHTEMMFADTEAKGCFIANSTVELSDDSAMQFFLKEHFQVMKSKLVEYLDTGSFKNDVDALAESILLHVTGISVLSKVNKDRSVFDKSNALFMQLIK